MSDAHVGQFFAALEQSLAAGEFVKLTLAKYRGREADLRNAYVRPLTVKKSEHLSILYRFKTKDVVKNYPVAEGLRLLRASLGAEFLSGHLFTLRQDLRVEFNRRREARLTSGPPTFSDLPPDAHDRRKRRAVAPETSAYLRALGVTDERGEVRPSMGDKFRQINKFVEIVGSLFASSPLAGRKELSVVDMGSGKGYLTFAVYDYLTNVVGVTADVTGVEARAELVELCSEAARAAGFDRLRFQSGYIQDFELPHTDILIALHACDTATDDALFKGGRSDLRPPRSAPSCATASCSNARPRR